MNLRTALLVLSGFPLACGDDGAADGGGTGTASEATTTAETSATAASMTSTTVGTSSESADTTATAETTAESSSTGGTSACEGSGNCTIYPPPCAADGCGGLDSSFDEDGCLRASCGIGTACARGERCYRAQLFGGCASSGTFCEDDQEQGACVCASDPDCSGSYCVPESLWPMAMPGPDAGQIDDACAPDDGAATELSFGGLGTCPMDEPQLRLTFFTGPPEVGTYVLESQSEGFGELSSGGGPVIGIAAAWVEITALADGVASGSYEVIADDAQHLAASFTDVPYCASAVPCG